MSMPTDAGNEDDDLRIEENKVGHWSYYPELLLLGKDIPGWDLMSKAKDREGASYSHTYCQT